MSTCFNIVSRGCARRMALTLITATSAGGLWAGVLGAAASPAMAGLPPYALVGSFELPAGTSSYDVLSDGRALAISGRELWLQESAGSGSFARVGSIAPGLISSFGASFLRVSPDGGTIALGNNVFGAGAKVLTLAAGTLNTAADSPVTSWDADNTDAHWADADTLYISGAGSGGSVVRELDLGAGASRVVVSNIGGASGGVVTDGTWLYTGNGFDFVAGGSETGEVRAFRLSDLNALAPGASADFEAAGLPVADALSAASLGFDGLGNLLVGGGDAFGSPSDVGYGAVVDRDAVISALGGGPIAPDSAELRLSPRLSSDSYFLRWNAGSDELLVTYFDNGSFSAGTTVFRYQVPSPGALALLVPCAVLGAARRRR